MTARESHWWLGSFPPELSAVTCRAVVTVVLGLSLVACMPDGSGGAGYGSAEASSGGKSSSGASSGGNSSGGSSSGGSSSGGSSSGGSSSGGSSSGGSSSGGSSSGGDPGGTALSVNAGGNTVGAFLADAYYSGGSTFSTADAIDTSGLTGDAPPASVFQTERYGEFTYTIPNRKPGGAQRVTLYFQESYVTGPGQRTFDVAVNGATVLTAFDIFQAAGGARKAIAKTFDVTADADGRVSIRFGKSGANEPKVCGITVKGETAPRPAVTGPCDLYEAGGTPCVAAHSTVRALYGAYHGRLYEVRRASDGRRADISSQGPGGFADSSAQDVFCAGTSCTISSLYDQSPWANHLTSAPAGGAGRTPDREADAAALKVSVGGHPVYAVYVEQGMGYRNNRTSGVATGDEPEGMYMVASGKHVNGSCCFDYGNAETNNLDNGNGTMEAIYLGNCTSWGKGSGSGPWVMADLENGLFAGGNGIWDPNTPVPYDYVTAMIKGKPHAYAVKAADAQSGGLKTMYDGPRPTQQGYDPMKKEGAIILGIGGDNSNWAVGTFFEGCMTSGYPSDETENAVQANIVEAGYGQTSSGGTSSGGASSGGTSSGGTSSGGARCPAGATLRPGDTRRTITAGGKQRSYVLHVPQSYTGTAPVPLLLDFHGYGGDGAGQQGGSGFNAQSDQHGFIAAFPDAIGACWNPGVPGLSCGEDDVGFARAIVAELSAQGCIDPKRVYANGFSQGGGMAYDLACNAADLFAAATASGFDLGIDCRPSRPVSVLSFRGTADRYDGSGNALIGAPQTLEKWKQLDGCTGSTATWNGCAVYQACNAGTEAGLCTIQNGGHSPGSAETGWAFLSRHALP